MYFPDGRRAARGKLIRRRRGCLAATRSKLKGEESGAPDEKFDIRDGGDARQKDCPAAFFESRRGIGDLFSALSRAKEASRRHALNRVFLFSHFAGEITFLPPIYGCNTSGIVTLPSACK